MSQTTFHNVKTVWVMPVESGNTRWYTVQVESTDGTFDEITLFGDKAMPHIRMGEPD